MCIRDSNHTAQEQTVHPVPAETHADSYSQQNHTLDRQFIETEKYDAKPTYKKFLGYSPGVAVINRCV